eukprot:551549-Pyramimonas_sp.AAC.1
MAQSGPGFTHSGVAARERLPPHRELLPHGSGPLLGEPRIAAATSPRSAGCRSLRGSSGPISLEVGGPCPLLGGLRSGAITSSRSASGSSACNASIPPISGL